MAVTINGTTGITTTGDYDAEDNDKILLGTGDDLQIFHDGNNNHIQGTTAGQSIYLKNDYEIQFLTSTNEKQLVTKANGACELYHDNVKTLETTSSGIKVTGTSCLFTAPDGGARYFFAEMGDNASAELSLYDSSDSQKCKISADSSQYTFFHSGGYVYIGTTSEPATGDNGCRFGGNSYHIVARNSGSTCFRAYGNAGENRLMGDGSIDNTQNSYGAISDRVLKENEVDASSQWDDIKSLKIKNYNLKAKPDEKHLGVIAQDLEASGMSGLVKDNPDELYTAIDDLPEGKNIGDVKEKNYKTVKYSILYMKAVKALQEAITKIETLETEVNTLKTKVAALEAA